MKGFLLRLLMLPALLLLITQTYKVWHRVASVRLASATWARRDVPSVANPVAQDPQTSSKAGETFNTDAAVVVAAHYSQAQDVERCVPCARRLAQAPDADLDPLFDQLLILRSDASKIRSQVIAGLPKVERAWLAYLVRHDRTDLADEILPNMLSRADADDIPVLLTYIERQLSKQDTSRALAVWNEMAFKQVIPFPVLRPAQGRILSNVANPKAAAEQGFDWRTGCAGTIKLLREKVADSTRLTLVFDGKGPDSCSVLSQFVPVKRNHSYLLRFQYRTEGMEGGTGLVWSLLSPDEDRPAKGIPLMASEAWRSASAPLTAPVSSLARLALSKTPEPGSGVLEGRLMLRYLSLEPLGPGTRHVRREPLSLP
jgi:hypothetical protein